MLHYTTHRNDPFIYPAELDAKWLIKIPTRKANYGKLYRISSDVLAMRRTHDFHNTPTEWWSKQMTKSGISGE